MKQEEEKQPVSPTGQYLNSSALSLSVIAVLELEVPIDDSLSIQLVKDVFLPINPRFSSIMIEDENGGKIWKKVEVKIEDHLSFPIFPSEICYDKYLEDYISNMGMEQFPQSQPLWEIHFTKYKSSNAACAIIFKFHHSLGDGFSLMGALLSCLQRADNPSLPLTFPSVNLPSANTKNYSIFGSVPKVFSMVYNTVSDFCWSLVKSNFVDDDVSPIHSGDSGVEFRPMILSTLTLSLDHIKQIKGKLGATVNDVITGIVFLGIRLYMHEMNNDSTTTHSTALVLLNTRMFRSYESVKDMVKSDAKASWGNSFAFLEVSIPKLTDVSFANTSPLQFVKRAQQVMNNKKSSLAVYFTGRLLQILTKFRGHEATARYIHCTIKNSSVGITNLIGPVEQMALANHPVKGFYFTVAGAPHSVTVGIVSYMGNLRVVVGAEKDFIDAHKLKVCIESAFEMILKAACESETPQKT